MEVDVTIPEEMWTRLIEKKPEDMEMTDFLSEVFRKGFEEVIGRISRMQKDN